MSPEKDIGSLFHRKEQALRHIQAAIAKGDKAEIKAWRTAFKRLNEMILEAGYRPDEPPEEPE